MNSNNTKKLEQLSNESVGRLLWRYSLPAVVGMLVMSLYNIIDRIFIGQGVGPEAIAGLAITFPVMNISAALGVLIGAGGSARISILLGAKDYHGARRVLGNALTLMTAIVVCYLTVFAIFIDDILTIFGASEVTLPYARDYMLYILPGLFMTNFSHTFNNFMRVSGYPVKAMVTMFIGAGVNVVLDPLFIFHFGWGIKGAAIATDISMAVSALFVMRHFFTSSSVLHFSRDPWMYRPDLRVIGSIVAIGAAPSLVNAAACFINVIINKTLYTHGGDIAVGAAGIFTSYTSLMTMVVVGLCQGMQPIIGYNHGAMKPGRVLLTLKYGVLAGTSFTTLGFLACVLFPRGIAGLFTDDASLISLAANGLRICVLAFPLIGSQIIIGNFFQAIGKARLAIFLSLTRQMLFLLPFLLVLPGFWGQNGVWASLPLADVLSFIVTLLFIRRFLKYYRLKNRHYLVPGTGKA